jgi:hypothetical protein
VIICWQDGSRAFPYGPDIYAKRITPAGALATGWPTGGAVVCSADYNQLDPQIVADGAGNAIVAWLDFRCQSYGVAPEIYIQKIRGTGGAWMWPGNHPFALCDPSDSFPLQDGVRPPRAQQVDNLFSLTTDGAGGAVIAWSRNAQDTYIQRVKTNGSSVTFEWDANLHASPAHAPLIQQNGTSGYHLAYMIDPPGSDLGDLVYERLGTNGFPVAGPLTVCNAVGTQAPGNMVSDEAGGVVIGWYDTRDAVGYYSIYAHRVVASGELAPCWPTNGRLITMGVDLQISPRGPAMVSDSRGGAVFVFPRDIDLFAMRVRRPAASIRPTGQAACRSRPRTAINGFRRSLSFSRASSSPPGRIRGPVRRFTRMSTSTHSRTARTRSAR